MRYQASLDSTNASSCPIYASFGSQKGNQFPYISHEGGKLNFLSNFLSCVW
ncbi:hypothetical protein LguiA_034770 [Lonicera macranthoides]